MSNNKQQISRVPANNGSYPFEKTHFDLIHLEQAFNADRYTLHFYCAFSKYHINYTLASKGESEFVRATQHFLTITSRWGYTVRILQTDGETALQQQWYHLINTLALTIQVSPPDTQSQNGYAERSGGVVVAMARRIHIESKLPVTLWPEFIDHAVRILNRLPIRKKDWTSPHECVHHHKPDLSQYRAVGSKCYVLVKKQPRLEKLRSRSFEGWLTGMSASNIYRVWLPQINRIVISRDVLVDEKMNVPRGA